MINKHRKFSKVNRLTARSKSDIANSVNQWSNKEDYFFPFGYKHPVYKLDGLCSRAAAYFKLHQAPLVNLLIDGVFALHFCYTLAEKVLSVSAKIWVENF
jgi:hypothetical protein